jgi:formylglycine-generating enzyme required for sulfatase activity
MEKQRKTFLSYSRANKDFAVKLARELKSEGFAVWLDQLDIPPGARWDAEVEKALTESEVFMVIMTQASTQSDNVLDEIGYAIDNGKRFLPVLLEKCNVPLRLRRFQYVDFTDKSFDEGVESAKELLRTLMAQPTIPKNASTEASQTASEQKAEARDDPNSTASKLRQEKIEQEMRFKAETEKLLKEKADLERKLTEEHNTNESMKAVKPAMIDNQPTPSKGRSKLIGVFGISILVIAIAGFAAVKLMDRSPATSVPTEAQAVLPDTPMATEAAAVIPVTAKDSPIPATAVPAESAAPTATEEASSASTDTLASERTDDKGAVMVLVPAGEFPMGSNRGETYEQPVHQVNLDAYYIDKYEVTNKLYKACVDDGQCDAPRQLFFFEAAPNKLYFGVSEYDNFPVVFVDWNMAKAFCQWRGARLPTEAEWEKAALGDTGNSYPWGMDLDCQKANYQKCVNRTSEVGAYPDGVSPYGLYDMTGNVWEWVSDWYADNYYANSPAKNPTGPITGQSRVIRGGSWARFDVTAYHRKNLWLSHYRLTSRKKQILPGTIASERKQKTEEDLAWSIAQGR